MKTNRVSTSTHVKAIHYQFGQGVRAVRFVGISLILLVLAVFLSIVIFGKSDKTTAAIQPDGFVCDGTFFQTRYTAGSGTSLLRINRSTSPYTATNVAQLTTGNIFMNGLAYNPIDGYLYEWYVAGTQIAVINNTGNVTLRPVTNTPSTNVTAAAIDENGIYYGIKDVGSGFTALEYFTIDLNQPTLTAVTHTLTGVGSNAPTTITNSPGDMVIDPTDPDSIYLVFSSKLAKISLSAGTIQYVNFANSLPNSAGSLFVDAAGTIYGYVNSGQFFQVNKTAGTGTIIESAPSTSASDGASCANSPTAIDATKSLNGSAQAINATTFRVPYQVKVANTTGDGTALPNVQLTEDLTRTFSAGSPTITISTAPALGGGSCALNGTFNGTTDTRLLTGAGTLADGASCTITFTVQLVYANVGVVPSGAQQNTVYASSTSHTPNNGYTFNTDGDPTPPIDLLAADQSTNSAGTPTLPNNDTPSPTPATLPTTPSMQAVKSVRLTNDINSNGDSNPGDTLTYTIEYHNIGNQAVTNFQISDTRPANTTYVAASLTVTPSGIGQSASANGSYDGVGSTNMLASSVSLVAGGSIRVTFAVTIGSSFTGTITNQASASGGNISTTLTDAADNSSTGDCQAPAGMTVPANSVGQTCTSGLTDQTTVTVLANAALLTVTKTDGEVQTNPNDTLTYTITITNPALGSSAANITLTDVLSNDTTFVSASSGGVHVSGTVTWSLGTIAGGASVTRTVTVTVNPDASDTSVLVNTASANSSSDVVICARGGSSCQGTDNTTVSATALLPTVDTTKSIDGSVQIVNPTTFRIAYRVGIYNTSGNGVSLSKAQLTENLGVTFGSGSPTITVSTAPNLVSGNCVLNTNFDGVNDIQMLDGMVNLTDGSSCVITFTVQVAYSSEATVPTTAQDNIVFASSTGSEDPNPGYTFDVDGTPIAPAGLLTSDISSNAVAAPGTPHGDTPSPTGILLSSIVIPPTGNPTVPGTPETGFAATSASTQQFIVGSLLLITAATITIVARRTVINKK